MTTKVTVTASGPCYPARLIKTDEYGNELRNELVANGHTVEEWCGTGQKIEVIEEYHPDGFAYPST